MYDEFLHMLQFICRIMSLESRQLIRRYSLKCFTLFGIVFITAIICKIVHSSTEDFIIVDLVVHDEH